MYHKLLNLPVLHLYVCVLDQLFSWRQGGGGGGGGVDAPERRFVFSDTSHICTDVHHATHTASVGPTFRSSIHPRRELILHNGRRCFPP